MEWLERMNRALNYFEENMAYEISIDEAARLAMCSTYHFQRMFSFITNIPLAEYIRRRRLTLAAQELHNSHAKVIDIAIKYGYDSPDAFTSVSKASWYDSFGCARTRSGTKGISTDFLLSNFEGRPRNGV